MTNNLAGSNPVASAVRQPQLGRVARTVSGSARPYRIGRVVGLAAVAIVLFVPSACSTEPDLADWIARADKICGRTDAAIAKLAPPGSSLVAMSAYAQGVETQLSNQKSALAKLDRPTKTEAVTVLDRYVDNQLDLVAQIRAASDAGNAETVGVLFEQSAQELAISGPRMAKEHGFAVCGTNGEEPTTTTEP